MGPSRGEGKGKEKMGGSVSGAKLKKGTGRDRPPCRLRIPVKSCLGTEKGWLDVNEKFVKTPPNTNREDYFRSYGMGCYFKPKFGTISDLALDQNLAGLEYINKSCNFDNDYLEEVRYAFQIPMEYEIRAAAEGEKIYHRGRDVWVGIPLDHFRAGLRLPLHRFIHSLLVGMRLGIGQIGPNSIRKICAFVARCTELNLEPTLSLFWSLHKLQASRGYNPLLEIHWRGGSVLGGVLVLSPTSNKGWHGEFVKVRGRDIGYLPEYRRPDGVVCGVKRLEHLEDFEEEEARRFVGDSEDGLWNEKIFLNPEFLYNHKCMGILHIQSYASHFYTLFLFNA